jgi:hypothetical protein
MKSILALAALLMTLRGTAAEIAVFAKNEIVVVGEQTTGAIPDSPDGRGFLNHFRDFTREHRAFEAKLPLINPPAWGKTIRASTHGEVSYLREFAHGFVCQLALREMAPNHRYILTLNGKPELQGNDALPLQVPGMAKERYYDFLYIETDAHGDYDATLGIFLKQSPYDVRIYVKDSADFKIVLYRDYFPFAVN